MRAASRRDVVEQLWWPLHTSTKRTNTRFQLYTDKVLCNITSSCVGGDGDGTLSRTIPSFFFFLFLIFLLFPRWALGVVGLYEKRIRLVKVMNLETLRHNCLTPPLLLLNWWWWCGVVVAYSFNCRLVSINFLRTVKRGKVTIITNDLFGCQSKSLCTCVRTCCIFFFLWIVLLIFLFLFLFSQLYELNDDAGRKAFLDELFDFMQKRGKSLNFVVFIREAKHCRRLRKLLWFCRKSQMGIYMVYWLWL